TVGFQNCAIQERAWVRCLADQTNCSHNMGVNVMNFANLKISTRLWLSFGLMMVIMAAIVVTGVMQMQTMNAATANVDRSSRNIENAVRILDGVNSMRRFQLAALINTGAERMVELDKV